jgi:methylenetetrahydrofolate reductase (NADPH)
MTKIDFSLELFPPRNNKSEANMWNLAKEFSDLNPAFVSVTTATEPELKGQTKTISINLAKQTNYRVAPHITCVGRTRGEIDDLAREYWAAGIRDVVALRGDVAGGGSYFPSSQGYGYANDLVSGLKRIGDFSISVACYPELHPDSKSEQDEFKYLKQKIDCGADRAISQFFFDPDVFLRYRDKAQSYGIEASLVPGIVPILNFDKFLTFADRCSAKVPKFLHNLFSDAPAFSEDHKLLAMTVMTYQITRLIDNGVNFFHIYTLNESSLSKPLCKWLRTSF